MHAGPSTQTPVQYLEPGDRADLGAQTLHVADGLVQKLAARNRRLPSRRIQRGQQKGAGAGGLHDQQSALDGLLQPRGGRRPDVKHRRLREAPDHLVGARDDQVGTR